VAELAPVAVEPAAIGTIEIVVVVVRPLAAPVAVGAPGELTVMTVVVRLVVARFVVPLTAVDPLPVLTPALDCEMKAELSAADELPSEAAVVASEGAVCPAAPTATQERASTIADDVAICPIFMVHLARLSR
jgi:hypothetical protein